MTVEKKKRIHKSPEQRQAEILSAATKTFAEQGYQVADTQSIADRAGVGKGTLYRYFPTKETLFKQALQRQLQLLEASIVSARKQAQNPLQKLKAMMGAYFKFFYEYPETIDLFAQERAEFGHDMTLAYCERFNYWKDELIPLFESVVQNYPVRVQSSETLFARFQELTHGAAYMSFRSESQASAYHQLDEIFEFFLFGVFAVGTDPMQYLNGA